MDRAVILAGKRVGERFALTASRSATLLGISHCEEDDDDDEDGAAQELDMSRLLHYEFLVALVLHRDDAECGEETEAEREETLHFRFVTRAYNTATAFSDARGARYSLAVAFIALRAGHHRRSVDFSLTPLDPPQREEEDNNTFALGVGPSGGGGTAVEKLDVMLLGVNHDATERMIQAELPTILSQWARDTVLYKKSTASTEAVVPDTKFCLFWEAQKFARNIVQLRAPPELFAASQYSLPLEGVLWGILQAATSAYILYMLEWSEDAPGKYEREALKVAGWHGDESPEVRARMRDLLGPYGFLTSHSVGVVIDLMMLFNEHGRLGSLAALGAVVDNAGAAQALIEYTVETYVHHVMSDEQRAALESAREEWAALTSDAEDRWYYDRFFAPFLLRWKSIDTAQIRDRALVFKRFVLYLVDLLARAGAPPDFYARPLRERVAEKYRALESAALVERILSSGVLEALREEHAARDFVLDPLYFAALDRQVSALTDNVARGLRAIIDLARYKRDPPVLLRIGDLVQRHRDALSLVHLLHTMDAMPPGATRRFAVILGSGHRRPLEELLFHSGRARTSGYHCVADTLQEIATPGDAVERHEWEPLVQAYLALEALDQWVGPPDKSYARKPGAEESTTEQPLARLYTYLLLEYGGLFEYYLPQASDALLLRSARYMALFALFATRCPFFYSSLRWALRPPPERKGEGASKKAQQREWKESIRATLDGARVARLLVELLVQCRRLFRERPRRGPGEFLLLNDDEAVREVVEPRRIERSLRSDWKSGMEQLALAKCGEQ